MSNREIFIDKLRQLSKEEMLERYIALLNTEKLTDYVADLEAKLAESEENNKLLEMQLQDMERSKLSWKNQYFTLYKTLKNYREVTENKLNQYPYKNDVIEEQYEDLKDGIKFRVENNISNDCEQLYHCIDVLCEKHKARIRDIENGICNIEKLEQQLAEKEKEIERLKSENHALMSDNAYQEADIFELNSFKEYYKNNKISFAVEQLEKFRDIMEKLNENNSGYIIRFSSMRDREKFHEALDNQIKQLKEGK